MADEPDGPRVYAVFGVSYDECDGYMWGDYDYLASDIFEDRDAAVAECLKMCDDFYYAEDPDKFNNPDILVGVPEKATWEQIRAAKEWQEPYEVRQLPFRRKTCQTK